jgi:hypothetical protein
MFGGSYKRCLSVADAVFPASGFKIAILVHRGIPLWLGVECVEQLSLGISLKNQVSTAIHQTLMHHQLYYFLNSWTHRLSRTLIRGCIN